MKPVTHHIKLFTVERVPGIRMSRELALADGIAAHFTKKRKTSTARKPRKKVELSAKARAAMAGLDPATRAFLEASM